jgi:predicted ATPase
MAGMERSLEECEQLAMDQRLLFFSDIFCPITRAMWLLWLDRPQEAQAQFRETLPKWLGAGQGIVVPDSKALWADSLLRSGDIDSALALLDEALDQIQLPGWRERSSLSNVLRVKACALYQAGEAERAEATFKEALSVAREQCAKSWELLAATSYGELMNMQGRKREALSLLQPIYDWFTEGHDTRDLREAAALLAELK